MARTRRPGKARQKGKHSRVVQVDPGETGSKVELALDKRLRARGWYFDSAAADHVCNFIERCCHHSKGKWAGQLIKLELWQRARIRRLFGWRRPDGTRRYRRSVWWVARKNGKSTLFAAIALYLTVADSERGAEVYSAASAADQALLVFNEAKSMSEKSPALSTRTRLLKNAIYAPGLESVYRVISSKASSKHGFNVHGLVIDELHTLKDRTLYDVLTTASGSRSQPMEFCISTAGDDIGGFAYEEWEYCRKIIDGVLENAEFLPVIYAADPTDDWRDEAVWAKANPNLGVSISLEYLRGKFEETKGKPGQIAAFKQLHLNIWTREAQAWLDLARWRKCLVKARSPWAYRGKRCWGGLDLSSTTDLTALALVFDMEDDGPLEAVVMFWVPEETAQDHERADRANYVSWIQQGYIRTTPGNVVDYTRVERDVAKVAKFCNLLELAFDRWGAAQISQRLQDEHGITMVQFGQGFKDMSPASKELERLILSRGIRIAENPVLTWNASNVVMRIDESGNIKPDKRKRGQKIDGIVALIMAVARATLGAEAASGYESHGIRSV